MEKYTDKAKNIHISAKEIKIGENVTFGKNITIKCKGKFSLGDFSRIGNNAEIYGNNISFGKHLFNSSGLKIGGGGRLYPNANFSIGDRCTIHNNSINVCEPIIIGNDVGLSPEVSLITHGYWQSALNGFPASFSGIKISDGVIIGYRSLVLMGVSIAKNCVIAAQSVVSKNCSNENGIYVGSPAVFNRTVEALNNDEKLEKLKEIINNYYPIAKYHGFSPKIKIDFPYVQMNDFRFNVETFDYNGKEDEFTDDFRDYMRKYGIRIYTERSFVSRFSFD